ncbi:MAG: tyrosine-protein phosphatase [Muribaculaceae bacterium]
MFGLFKKKRSDIKLPYHTEVHCHIMPGVDHGARDVEQSLALIRHEMDLGISRIVFTPHVTANTFENTPQTLAEGFASIKAAVEEAGLDVELFYSAEYRLDDYWMEQRKNKCLVPMLGNYLLVENNFQQELLMMDDLMFELQLEGFIPVLAHPERYPYYGFRHDRYRSMHNAGVKFQVNLLSLSGYFGSGARASAVWLIDNNFCDFLGSDMHGEEHALVIKEYLQSKDWSKMVDKLQGRLLNDVIGR